MGKKLQHLTLLGRRRWEVLITTTAALIHVQCAMLWRSWGENLVGGGRVRDCNQKLAGRAVFRREEVLIQYSWPRRDDPDWWMLSCRNGTMHPGFAWVKGLFIMHRKVENGLLLPSIFLWPERIDFVDCLVSVEFLQFLFKSRKEIKI